MLDRGNGVIVNIASVAGQVGVPRRAAYCASKAGLVGLTKAIAVDHARQGIRSVAICPGTVDTEWIGKILSDAPDPAAARAAMAARQLDGQMGTPEEIAEMVAFVAGPNGRFINGAALVVDGGMTAA
jgi:NAD(P)-dependent dehydrogenase (short-subunit alcohol dehydrogenase family)